MLANKYQPGKIQYPCFVQPKLNGIRALAYNDKFQSRDENFWDSSVLPHLFTQLKGFSYPTDGELYRHGMSLQEINSRVAVMRQKPHDKVSLIEYHIFDLIFPDSSFHKRYLAMKYLKEEERFSNTPIKFVDTFLVHSDNEADYYYRQFREQGFEGMMYRDPHAGYGVETRCTNKENRWKCLLKRKEMLEGEATIIGFNEGEGQFTGALGAFSLQFHNSAVFDAGSGLTHIQRFSYWQKRDVLLGMVVKFRYEMLSDSGTPLKPIIDFVKDEHGIL